MNRIARQLVRALAAVFFVTLTGGITVGVIGFVEMVRMASLPSCELMGVPEPVRSQAREVCLNSRSNLDAGESVNVYAVGW